MTSASVSAFSFPCPVARDGVWLLALVASLVTLGCGDASTSRDAITVDSGLAPDKLLASLSEQEARLLCEATIDAADELKSTERQRTATCTIAAALLSVELRDGELQLDREACERSRDECLAQPRNAEPVETRSSCVAPAPSAGGAPTCSASVAEYERCFTAALHAAADAIDAWDCSALAKEPLKAFMSETTSTQSIDVPECESFEVKCGSLPPL